MIPQFLPNTRRAGCAPAAKSSPGLSRAALFRVLISIATLAPTTTTFAGDWHYGAGVVCSDCHTQHNSINNQPMRTDNDATPAPGLLLRGSAQELCLSCHDGSKPEAPDVVTPVGYVSDPAGGQFPNGGGIPTNLAHHLLNPTPEVPPGGSIPMILTCTTCHDPHGNASYRNLRPDPTMTSQSPVVVMSSQAVVANGNNPAAVYSPSNVVYKSGISAWCATCHAAPDPSVDHPVEKTIFGSTIADYSRWAAVTLPRVPTQSPLDDVIPSSDDQVTCLSCHKAHGSANPKALIYADGTTIDSTCQECHNQ